MCNSQENQIGFVVAFEDRYNTNPARIDVAEVSCVEDHPACGSIIHTKQGTQYRHPYTAFWVSSELGIWAR